MINSAKFTGLLYTDEPVTRVFSRKERVEMRINISSTEEYFTQIIRSLVWSHNGTELTTEGRISISNDGTSLTISNMVESDAGQYKVKIKSTYFNDGRICDRSILLMMENLAFYAPVTFTLQKSNLPTYPEDVVLDYALPAYQGPPHKSMALDNVFTINVPAAFDIESTNYEELYKNGVVVRGMTPFHRTTSYGNVTAQSLRIMYNNTEDVSGHYYYMAFKYSVDINRDICPHYRDYLDFGIDYIILPIFILHWNIRSYSELIL